MMERYHFHYWLGRGEYIIQRNGFIPKKMSLSGATIFTVAQSMDGDMITGKAPVTTPSKLKTGEGRGRKKKGRTFT